jgi:aryl-alcohol dehydrogenase-like predicted oxidoreductase
VLQAAALSASSKAFAKLPAGGSVPKRTLGRTGESVSMIGLGGYHLGLARDEDESVRIVRMALDHGITFLDNCWDYNDGESETRMGRALQGGYRKKAFLMTKLDGRTGAAATAQLEQSLKRLQTDVVDLVQIHEVIRMDDAERVFARDGAIEALVAARKAGKLRYIGFTGHKSPQIHLHMLEVARKNKFAFDTVQMPLNAMDPHFRSFEKKVLPVLVERRIGVLGMKPMGAGLLLESGAVKAPECLRYSMSLPASVVITGCDSVPVLRQALSVAMQFKPLRPDEKKALLARTAKAGAKGEYEKFKTTNTFDGTAQHPWWLTEARL